MLLDPAQWLTNFMELTPISLDFAFVILLLAGVGFVIAYVGERSFFNTLARWIGVARKRWRGEKRQKRKKEYKILQEELWGKKGV